MTGTALYRIDEGSGAADPPLPLASGVSGFAADTSTGHLFLADYSQGSFDEVTSGPCATGDVVPPTVTFTSPADGATYTVSQQVGTDFSCTDEGGLALRKVGAIWTYCGSAPGPNGPNQLIDTSAAASGHLTVTAADESGNTTSITHNYTVAAGVPQAPTISDASNNDPARGDAGVWVSWDPPASDGGSPITSYTVAASPRDVPPVTVDGSVRYTEMVGLTPGTAYTFTVTASNAHGSRAAVGSIGCGDPGGHGSYRPNLRIPACNRGPGHGRRQLLLGCGRRRHGPGCRY